MEVNPRCDLCENHAETLIHALWSCDKVKKIWKLIPWYKKCDTLGEGSTFDLLQSLAKTIDRNEFEDAIRLLNWVFSAYPPPSLHGDTAVQPKATQSMTLKQWQPPAKGSICVNCDAAVQENSIGVAEAWAILEAIKRAPAAATGPIEIQSDRRAVVDKLKNQGQYFNVVSTILH
ncbi:hypothetical protein F8388_018153 [Cannabis sativa]|uniref:RNase H type-1 domain-containing protein n=1 Tax=Cannabis sativa TaxID=3483 RepID=A0A7J6GCZ7_CANSA|nr:hypothetical protein F8388_018153 [Cannabis sativa]